MSYLKATCWPALVFFVLSFHLLSQIHLFFSFLFNPLHSVIFFLFSFYLPVSPIFSLTRSHLVNVICSPSLVSVRETQRGEKLWKCVNVWIGLQLTHSLQSPRVNTNCKLIKLCTLALTLTHTHVHTYPHAFILTEPCFPNPSIQIHAEGLKSQRLWWWKPQ